TGNCSCNWQWYTFGMNPGKLTVTATMHTFQHALAKSWGIRLFLYKGKSLLTWKQTACWSTQTKCERTISVGSNVRKQGIYYVKVEGPGADGIQFTIRVSGNMYTLKCKQTC